MRRWTAKLAVAAALSLPLAVAAGVELADASAAYTSLYTYDQTFGTALRYVRVDQGFKITEKDPELGYVMFEYTSPESGSQVTPGSIEIVRGQDRVLVTVQIPKMPRYHEQALVEGLARKLVAEHGEPVRKKPDPPPPPEGGADGGADAGP